MNVALFMDATVHDGGRFGDGGRQADDARFVGRSRIRHSRRGQRVRVNGDLGFIKVLKEV
jgi:hypothetical protein